MARLPDLPERRQVEENRYSHEQKESANLTSHHERVGTKRRENHDWHPHEERELAGVLAEPHGISPQPDSGAGHVEDVQYVGAQRRRYEENWDCDARREDGGSSPEAALQPVLLESDEDDCRREEHCVEPCHDCGAEQKPTTDRRQWRFRQCHHGERAHTQAGREDRVIVEERALSDGRNEKEQHDSMERGRVTPATHQQERRDH